MAKRTYRRISSYLSYKYFDRVNREKWVNQYRQRTGRDTARGWNFSPEYQSYIESQKGRIITYAQRNPTQFFEKKDTILKRSDTLLSQQVSYSAGVSPVFDFLNPMKGAWGPEKIRANIERRAIMEGKKSVIITRIKAPLILGGTMVATSKNELEKIRRIIASNYGRNVADGNLPGTYYLIGANYKYEIISTGSTLLGVIDVELFLY